MLAYKKTMTINDSSQLVLKSLPFRPGQRVEVVVIAEEEEENAQLGELKKLLIKTQQLPNSKIISEQEIAEDIAAYRAGR